MKLMQASGRQSVLQAHTSEIASGIPGSKSRWTDLSDHRGNPQDRHHNLSQESLTRTPLMQTLKRIINSYCMFVCICWFQERGSKSVAGTQHLAACQGVGRRCRSLLGKVAGSSGSVSGCAGAGCCAGLPRGARRPVLRAGRRALRQGPRARVHRNDQARQQSPAQQTGDERAHTVRAHTVHNQ